MESIECAITLNSIGSLYNNLGKLDEAFKYYTRALSIYERVKGKESFDCANTLNNIGSVYKKHGKLN